MAAQGDRQGQSVSLSSCSVYVSSPMRKGTGKLLFPVPAWRQAAPVSWTRFQSADQEPPPHLAFQTHDPDIGITVGERFSTNRAVGYGAALNLNIIFVIVNKRVI